LFVWFSCFGFSFRFGELFQLTFFLSCFGFMAVVLGHPETQTVSHSFPKLCAALQRKFGADAAYPAPATAVFSA
jgi:hypothetical protein